MIERRDPLSLSRQCVLMGLSRAALYYLSGQDRRLRTGTDGAGRSPVSANSLLWFAADGSVASGAVPCSESQAGAALDATDGTGGRLPRLMIPSKTELSPLECCRGVNPSPALNSRPVRHWRASPANRASDASMPCAHGLTEHAPDAAKYLLLRLALDHHEPRWTVA
jgi:hypothetical protein